jgi:predicted dehydrogenase
MTERAGIKSAGIETAGMKFLVSGSGSIGRRHMRNLRSLGVVEIAACDPEPERLAPMVAELKIQPYSDFEQALQTVQPDAVLICTPPSFHLAQAKQAIAAGAHVFVEKPLSHSMEGVKALLAESRATARVVQVGYNLRFHPAIRKLKQIVDENTIGRILWTRAEVGQYLPDWRPWQDYRQSYTARRELGGGIILDASHELDYLLWFFGEPTEVLCMASTVSRLTVNVEDSASLLLRFASGSHADLHVDFVQRVPSRSCKLVGEEGTAIWQENDVRILRPSAQPEVFHYDFDDNDMYVAEVKQFLACISDHQPPLVGAEHGAKVLEWALAARAAAEAKSWSSTRG